MNDRHVPGRWRWHFDKNDVYSYYNTRRENLLDIQRYNIQTFRSQPLAEISGSLGDLGTLLPILIALTEQGSISISSTLVVGGIANIVTGIIFGIPLPVQPMKAIAAVAIARRFSQAEIMSAGLFVAACIGFLSLSGLIRWFTNRIPIPIIKGIQVGTGLSLIISAGGLYPNNHDATWIFVLAFVGLLACATFKRVPYALIICLIGIFIVILGIGPEPVERWHWHGLNIWHPRASIPSPSAFVTGMLDAGIGQLPLTTLNSVIAVSFLAADLLPDVPTPSTSALGLSVMTVNLIGCWFGSMPVCHGSGGLAAQYRFGARSGASIIFLGLIKLLLGLFASTVAHDVFTRFPKTFLCIMLIAAGLELVKVGESLNTSEAKDLREIDTSGLNQPRLNDSGNEESRLSDEERKRRWAVMFMTVAGILAFRNDAVGFAAGVLCHVSFRLQDRWEERSGTFHGPISL